MPLRPDGLLDAVLHEMALDGLPADEAVRRHWDPVCRGIVAYLTRNAEVECTVEASASGVAAGPDQAAVSGTARGTLR
jgi:hypothetical protein